MSRAWYLDNPCPCLSSWKQLGFRSSLSACSAWINLLPLFQAIQKDPKPVSTSCHLLLLSLSQIPSPCHTNVLISSIILLFFLTFEGGWGWLLQMKICQDGLMCRKSSSPTLKLVWCLNCTCKSFYPTLATNSCAGPMIFLKFLLKFVQNLCSSRNPQMICGFLHREMALSTGKLI